MNPSTERSTTQILFGYTKYPTQIFVGWEEDSGPMGKPIRQN
jgi:hypothetical protein